MLKRINVKLCSKISTYEVMRKQTVDFEILCTHEEDGSTLAQ